MKSLKKLLIYLKPHGRLIVGSLLLAIPLAALRVSPVPLVQKLVDEIFVAKDERKLMLLPMLVLAIFFLNFVVRFFHYYLIRVVIVRVNQRIKNDLFRKVIGLSADYFTDRSVGTLISRVGSDPQQIDAGVSSISAAVREPVTFLFLFGTALYLNWKLTLVMFAVLPFLAWIFSATGRNLKRYIHRLTEANADLFSVIQESVTGVRIIKAFKLEPYVQLKFESASEKYSRTLRKTAILEELAHPGVELITAFAIAAVLYYGGAQVLGGSMRPGELMGFFTAFALMMNPLRMINDLNMKFHQTSGAAERIFEVLDWKSNLVEKKNAKTVHDFESSVEFQNVSFSYPDAPERRVLEEISFILPKGGVYALVGSSGSGKSSLVSLIPRIYDVTGGSIRIDGTDVRDIKIDDLRSLISIVSQDVFLFNDTVEENIRCGRLNAKPSEIEDAARSAHAWDFIQTLPKGLQTVIGDRGMKLSGGERQRISIARAFLRQAPILLLDEATSSLDTASERTVQAALERLMNNRTTLIIAHRLSTVRSADQILVIHDGKIVESGRHEDLIRKQGEYFRLNQASELSV